MCVYVDGSQCQRQSRWRIFSYAPLRDAVSTVSDCKQLSVCACVLLKAGVYTLKGPRRVSRSDPKGDKVSASDQECWQGSYRAPSAPLSCWIIDGLSQHSPHTHTHTYPDTHTHTLLWRWIFFKFKHHSETHGRHSPLRKAVQRNQHKAATLRNRPVKIEAYSLHSSLSLSLFSRLLESQSSRSINPDGQAPG